MGINTAAEVPVVCVVGLFSINTPEDNVVVDNVMVVVTGSGIEVGAWIEERMSLGSQNMVKLLVNVALKEHINDNNNSSIMCSSVYWIRSITKQRHNLKKYIPVSEEFHKTFISVFWLLFVCVTALPWIKKDIKIILNSHVIQLHFFSYDLFLNV